LGWQRRDQGSGDGGDGEPGGGGRDADGRGHGGGCVGDADVHERGADSSDGREDDADRLRAGGNERLNPHMAEKTPFEIILEERDRLKLEVAALKAELVRRDAATEFAVPVSGTSVKYGMVSVPLNLFEYHDHEQRYGALCKALSQRFVERFAGHLDPRRPNPLIKQFASDLTYDFRLYYVIP